MKILAIETSCDETAAAIVENGTTVIASALASSYQLHLQTGGVIPEIAAREQLKFMIPILKEIKANPENIDAIAVTVGPGLIGSLLVGVETAKTLSFSWKLPLVPINHLVAHIYGNWIISKGNPTPPMFPCLCLVVSGGHTELVLMQNHGRFLYLGGTRDDAGGEAFDKTARLLGLTPFNGGPAISQKAQEFRNLKKTSLLNLPRPMIYEKNYDFSFSGLKTAVLREVNKQKSQNELNEEKIAEISFALEEAITDVLSYKVKKAALEFGPQSILLSGGVSANRVLREKVKNIALKLNIPFYTPSLPLCADNAVYMASAAFFNYHPKSWKQVTANPSLEIV